FRPAACCRRESVFCPCRSPAAARIVRRHCGIPAAARLLPRWRVSTARRPLPQAAPTAGAPGLFLHIAIIGGRSRSRAAALAGALLNLPLQQVLPERRAEALLFGYRLLLPCGGQQRGLSVLLGHDPDLDPRNLAARRLLVMVGFAKKEKAPTPSRGVG